MLYKDYLEDYAWIIPHSTADSEGGRRIVWEESRVFKAAVSSVSESTTERGDKAELSGNYTLITDRSFTLVFHSVIKRLSDGAMFRIISGPISTPARTSLDMRQYTVEDYHA